MTKRLQTRWILVAACAGLLAACSDEKKDAESNGPDGGSTTPSSVPDGSGVPLASTTAASPPRGSSTSPGATSAPSAAATEPQPDGGEPDPTSTPDGGSPSSSAPPDPSDTPPPASASTAPPSPSASAPPAASSSAPPATGQELFTSTGCAACHGSDGQGTATMGPEIRHPSDQPFDEIVSNGTGTHVLEEYSGVSVMIGYGALLDKAERDSIRDWLKSFPKPTTGAELYADYCSYCHGADGRGSDMSTPGANGGPAVVGAYVTKYHSAPFSRLDRAAEIAYVRAGHVAEGGSPVEPHERRAYMPAFPSSVLSDPELTLILDWMPQ